jgi:hypothetical protein
MCDGLGPLESGLTAWRLHAGSVIFFESTCGLHNREPFLIGDNRMSEITEAAFQEALIEHALSEGLLDSTLATLIPKPESIEGIPEAVKAYRELHPTGLGQMHPFRPHVEDTG